MNAATNNGDIIGATVQELEEIIRSSAEIPYDDIWINGDEPYPCLVISVNGGYACVHYFLNDTGDMWQSEGYHDRDIVFMMGGEKTEMPADSVISLEAAITCIKEFFCSFQKPTCIAWREL